MTILGVRPIQLALRNTVETITLYVRNNDGELVDASNVTLRVLDGGENVILQDNFTLGYGTTPALPTRIVKPAGTTGIYHFPFGDTSFDARNSTAVPSEYLFHWTVQETATSETVHEIHVVKVVSARTMRWIPKLRTIVDKLGKVVDEDPLDPVYLGYTDSQLVQFFEGGLGWINAFQPYPMWSSVDQFPDLHWRVLLDAAVCDALTSQEIFAIDTDINYSDQGNTFVVDHQPKLSAVLNATWTRLATMVPPMKRHFVDMGAVRVEAGPNFRFAQLLTSSPTGSMFRNMFMGGP